jgi:hypothetical protein
LKTSIIIISIIILTGCASHYGEGWSKADTYRQSAYTALHVADWGQTRYIASHPDEYYEVNPVLGKHPDTAAVDTWMASTLAAHWLIAPALKPKYRKWFQYVAIGVEGACVLNNLSLGIGIGF